MYTRYVTLASAVLAAACARPEPAVSPATAALLRSADRAAVYNGGVEAYRAEDYATARLLWRRAAALGDAVAMGNLGLLLYYGRGGTADSAGAAALWSDAMRRGHAEAHYHVAAAAADGDARFGIPSDAYAHAVAAELLAVRPGELDGPGVARNAREVADRVARRLSPGERALAAERGRALAADTSTAAARPAPRRPEQPG